MNILNYQGKNLQIIKFNNELYRADKDISSNYSPANIKYFTLKKKETNTYANYYAKKGCTPYIKTWKPKQDLILIDILDMPTRLALSEIIGNKSLDISFPIKRNKVSRVSEEDTKNHDDIVLRNICNLNLADGYIMKGLNNNNGNYVFHSEIGLCKNAFSKLTLIISEKDKNHPPAPKRKCNTNKNNIVKSPKRRKTIKSNNNNFPRVSRFGPLSFNNF